TQALLERISATLGAAAVDEDARPLLRAGRLVGEVEPAGFSVLAAMAPATPPPRGERKAPERPDRGAARREAQARVRELRATLREREREAREAERKAERTEQEAAAARAAAEQAHAAAAEAE